MELQYLKSCYQQSCRKKEAEAIARYHSAQRRIAKILQTHCLECKDAQFAMHAVIFVPFSALLPDQFFTVYL